ncbi:MAG: type II secretion system minor pseudopilin GspK [Pseudomonadales bacterium]
MAGTAAVRRQQGVVLLSVLLVLALLSALAWQLMGKHTLVIAQARFSFTADQTAAYALGAEAFARQILFEEWQEGGADKDTLLEAWAQPAAPFEIEEGFLEIQIRDLHRCFNLNSLAGSAWEANLARLKTLLRNRGVPEGLADAWKDWVDADQEVHGFGAEDGAYLLEPVPYRTADVPAAHVSELRLVRGMEAEYMEVLAPVLCTLPNTDLRVNVNTAAAAVLAAMAPGLSEPQMEAFTSAVRDYDDTGTVVTEFPDLAAAVDALTVTSEYFQVDVRAQVDDGQTELSSVLRRDPTTGKIELISRNFGPNFQTLFRAEPEAAS